MNDVIYKNETELRSAIVEYLEAKGIFCWKDRQTSKGAIYGFSKSNGVSDILGVLNGGRILAIEVKLPKNKPTLEQANFIRKVNELGGLAFVAYSLDDISRYI